MRADGTPTYNFGVVVDDFDMNITHVIRGDDHVNNTPRQINILQALRAPLPEYAHVPMILGHDGERLSKRHGAVSVLQYRDDGYLPEALINYLARLGWAHGDDEIFSREQFVSWFELDAINKAPARFDPEKLSWVNQQYIKKLDDQVHFNLIASLHKLSSPAYQIRPEVAALYKDRVPPNQLVKATEYFYVRPHLLISMSSDILVTGSASHFSLYELETHRSLSLAVRREGVRLCRFLLHRFYDGPHDPHG